MPEKNLNLFCYASFDELTEQARILLDNAERKNFDLGLSWFSLLTRTALDKRDTIKIYVLTESKDTVKLVLPLKVKQDSQELFSLVNFYSAVYLPAFSQKDSTAILIVCLAAIRQEKPAWNSLRLQPLDRDSNEYYKLKKALHKAGWMTFEFFCFGNWYLPVPASGYREFFANLPSPLKNTLKKKSKQFSSKANGQLKIVSNSEDLETAIQDYEHVYAASWKKPEPYPEFIPGLIRLCAARGWLRLGLAYIDGEIAAAQIWIVHQGRASIYKLAYDSRFEHYSVGTILTDHLMRHVIEVDHVQEIDYLIGDDPYKRDWMTHRRERWGLIAYNPRTLAGLGGAAAQFARDRAKGLLDWLGNIRQKQVRWEAVQKLFPE